MNDGPRNQILCVGIKNINIRVVDIYHPGNQ